ncbi:MAG: hypothetical protein ACR2JQ_03120 [Mycobacteriales bacterium]
MARGLCRRSRPALLAALLVALAVVAGCASTISGDGSYASEAALKDAPNVELAVHGTDHGESDRIAENAISDIQRFWTNAFPPVFGTAYRPVTGGFYSVDPATSGPIPCASSPAEVKGNAFYCGQKDVVVWDRTNLLPVLAKNFGKFTIAMVLAHEWGHAIQKRSYYPGKRTIVIENEADCYSGAWTAWAFAGNAPHFHVSINDLDSGLAGFLTFADAPGDSANANNAHGSGFDRVSSFQQGFDHGAAYCANKRIYNDNKVFTEVPFDPADQNNGNLPLDQAFTDGIPDLTAFSTAAMPKLFDLHNARPLGRPVLFNAADDTKCGDTPIEQTVMYCAADDKVYLQVSPFSQQLYKGLGDNSVITMLAIGNGYQVRQRQGKSLTGEDALLGAVCYAGLYDADAFNATAHKPTVATHQVTLSAGDLDEAIGALLVGVGKSDFGGEADTNGFLRVNVFQNAVRNGASACARY